VRVTTDLAPLPAARLADFRRDGFLVIHQVTTTEDLALVRSLLDALFDRFDALPAGVANDLAGAGAGAPPRIPDLIRPSRLEPRLRATLTYRRARALAAQLLGGAWWDALYTFDHAIYKPPRNAAATPWHQDQAYAGYPEAPDAVHFWIPLQDATEANGCMWFVPGTHRGGVVPHEVVATRGRSRTLRASKVDEGAAVCCPVAAGGATVHTPLTLHYTGANRTDAPRRAWILHFARFGRLGLLRPRNLMAKARQLAAERAPAGREPAGREPASARQA
jgi:hypothetical protein